MDNPTAVIALLNILGRPFVDGGVVLEAQRADQRQVLACDSGQFCRQRSASWNLAPEQRHARVASPAAFLKERQMV